CRGPGSNRYGSHLPQDFKSLTNSKRVKTALYQRFRPIIYVKLTTSTRGPHRSFMRDVIS
ncbi:hypothetical protein KSP24_03230, partial [Paenibacillus sp. AK121]|uniref:hypothetical protein n=1 Tax=Paenibacillus sp. AK121 TaxID=2849670 RepID=UPI001C220FD3